jgi:hypothetical protein
MKNNNNKKEATVKVTDQPEVEWSNKKIKSYVGYLYNQNERLWNEIESMGKELNELRAQTRGEY